MATLNEIESYLDTLIPRALSCEWDNDGMMVCEDRTVGIKKVLFTLDVTPAAITRAEELGVDLIISHHPLIFKGIKHMDGADTTSEKVIRLLRRGIAVMSFHTRLDCVKGGVNDILAADLGLTEVTPFDTEDGPVGRIGTLNTEMTLEAFCLHVKKTLGAPALHASKGKPTVRRVAVLGGAGRDYVGDAMAAGADAYLTGEANYHSLMDAAELGFSVITAGHDFTERHFFAFFENTLCKSFPEITCYRHAEENTLFHV